MAYGTSASDRLARVREAIDAALSAQSYTVRNRGKVNANVAALFAQEQKLIDEVEQGEVNGGCMASLALQVRPT